MREAYPDIYLYDAMRNLGEMVEYAETACGDNVDRALQMFVVSGYAERWEDGDPRVLCGLSGTELYQRINERCGVEGRRWAAALTLYKAGEAYWSGYTMAYYQWKKNYPFHEVLRLMPYPEWQRLWPSLHTASEDKCVEVIDCEAMDKRKQTRLQAYRRRLHLTQKQLAEEAGINLRTLQQYEIRDKEISQAATEKVRAMARVLGCRVEDIISE